MLKILNSPEGDKLLFHRINYSKPNESNSYIVHADSNLKCL